jgi:DNA-directed RNA polymerase subunit RPC12/RpoP
VYQGIIACPQCDSSIFTLADWETYISVICRYCGHKMGELDGDG